MPRPMKIDDTYQRISYWTKLFMYSDINWDNIGPIVEIIRYLQPSIISYKYGKGQTAIKNYSKSYNHRSIGYDFKTQKDYLNNIIKGLVKFIIIFSDSETTFTSNLINLAKEYSIVTICYSNFDRDYYFYNYSITNEPIKMKSGLEVVEGMKQMSEYIAFKQVVDVFPDFNLIPEEISKEQPILEKCLIALKESSNNEQNKKDKKKIVLIKKEKELKESKEKELKEKPFFDPQLLSVKKYFSSIKGTNVQNIPPDNINQNNIISETISNNKGTQNNQINKKPEIVKFFKKKVAVEEQ